MGRILDEIDKAGLNFRKFDMMKQVAEFEIKECYGIANKGLVIAGEIISGKIDQGDFITFTHDKNYTFKISDVNYVDKRQLAQSFIGLTLVYDNDAEKDLFRDVKLLPQTALITAER